MGVRFLSGTGLGWEEELGVRVRGGGPPRVPGPAGSPRVASPGPPPPETSQSEGRDPAPHYQPVCNQTIQATDTPEKKKKRNQPESSLPRRPSPSPPGAPAPGWGSEREPGAPRPSAARRPPAAGAARPRARPARAPPAPALLRLRGALAGCVPLARPPARLSAPAARARPRRPGPAARASWLRTNGTGSSARSSSDRSATSESRTFKVTRRASPERGVDRGSPGAPGAAPPTPTEEAPARAAPCPVLTGSCHLRRGRG